MRSPKPDSISLRAVCGGGGAGVALRPQRSRRRWATAMIAAMAASAAFTNATQNAVANGDTRTLYLTHAHTKESIAATFRVDGRYNAEALRQLNWFLRDWRRDEPINMDPRLFDVVWEVYRSAGAGNSEVTVMSAYRSPETNSMLRSRSRAVAKHSQHMEGKAMDTSMPGMPMSQVREIGMRLQRGGVGYYPSSGTPFVHLDVGSVRSWPRMGYDQLARLFPDGKTVHLPSNGQPLARYEEARAELEARGGVYLPPSQSSKGFFAFLFGGGEEDEDRSVRYERPSSRGRGATQTAQLQAAQTAQLQTASRQSTQVAAYAPTPASYEDGGRNFFASESGRAQDASPAAADRSQSRRGVALTAPASQSEPAQIPPPPLARQPANEQKAEKPQPLDSDDNDATATPAPLPPRRPNDLLAYAAQAPLPPIRPNFGGSSPSVAPVSQAHARSFGGVDRNDRHASPASHPTQLMGLRAAIRPQSGVPQASGVTSSGITGMRSAVRAQAGLAERAPSQWASSAPAPAPRPQNAGLANSARTN